MLVQAHEDRNLARELTPAEKKEKKHQKLVGQADEAEAPTVNVYRVRSLADPRHRFKVRVNADVSAGLTLQSSRPQRHHNFFGWNGGCNPLPCIPPPGFYRAHPCFGGPPPGQTG